MNLPQAIARRKKTVITASCIALLLSGVAIYFYGRAPRLSPNVTTPVLAVEALDAKAPYYTPSAVDALKAKMPQWVAAHDSKEEKADFALAGQNPALWRKLDRKYHFDAVLLSGDPSEYRELMDHLITTKDWMLVYVDHTSFIFQRPPAKPWSLNACRGIIEKFAAYPPADRSVFLTQFAAKFLAIGQIDLAKQLLDESAGIDPKSPETWTQLAQYETHRGKWDAALQNVTHALQIAPNDSHALTTKAQIFYATKQYDQALQISARLTEANPDNPNVLFFHAKIAHDAAAYQQEIPTLKHLVEIVEKHGLPTAGFRIYLAQAYARDGQAAASLEEFEKARDEGGLSDDQRTFIEESIQTIKSRTAL